MNNDYQSYVEFCNRLGIASLVQLCECGCGLPAPIAQLTNKRLGYIKGQPVRFILGHQSKALGLRPPKANNKGKVYNVIHGQHTGGKTTPEINAFQSAKSRCTNPNDKSWERYGGRGIQFLFESFEQFFAELGSRPADVDAEGKPLYSLDRINNDGNYQPGNVRWATRGDQQKNREPFEHKINRINEENELAGSFHLGIYR